MRAGRLGDQCVTLRRVAVVVTAHRQRVEIDALAGAGARLNTRRRVSEARHESAAENVHHVECG